MAPITIDYTTIDFDALKNELIGYLQETQSFSDVQYVGSNINTLVQLFSYLGSLFGFYTNSIANEPFLPSAKRYKNLNRIAKLLAYNPKGPSSAQANVVGDLTAEYAFGKQGVYFEIPAYSVFPANKQTPLGQNFSFTNPQYISYSVKAYGVRPVAITDFSYGGNALPLTNPVSFWTPSATGTPTFDPTQITLNLSDTLPLTILDRLDPTNAKEFDTSVPLFDPTDSASVGQPFNRSISINTNTLRIIPGTVYYIVFTYDTQTAAPTLCLMEEGPRLQEKIDNVITSIKLMPTDASNQFYTLQEVTNNALGRFYVGVMGMQNLDSVDLSYSLIPSTSNAIQQINLEINKTGDKPPFKVLVDGVEYTFSSGTISSQVFTQNSWDVTQPSYNVILNIVTPDAPEFNYDATLNVTSQAPGANEVVIATIYPSYTDPDTGTTAISQTAGQRFGNFQVVPPLTVESTEQKTGFVTFPENVTSVFIAFDTPFIQQSPLDTIDYIVQLTPSDNVQVWFSDKSPAGFTINVEANTDFTGQVNWVATRYIQDNIRQVQATFLTPIPQINEQNPDYTIFLTPSDNVVVWYTNKTPTGFMINVEKSFTGTVSYSTFVYSDNEEVIAEANAASQQKGSVAFGGAVLTKDITFSNPFPDLDYGLHMICDQNVNTWYTNKTTTGFTINVDSTYVGQLNVDWYADESPTYVYQKHGMIDFSGQLSSAGTLPGIRFTNIDETFLLPTLKQGDILFSHINANGTIDQSNNQLSIQFAAARTNPNDLKVDITLQNISYTDVRVFVSDSAGNWDEWKNGSSLIQSVDVSVGEQVFFVRFNEYKQIEISFGDGVNFGTNPFGNEIIIFGLNTVGSAGNVPANTIGPSVILSENILGDANVTIQFEAQFIQMVGLKTQTFFSSSTQSSNTVIYDSEGTEITSNEFSVVQTTPASLGGDEETTEQLRANAGMANLRQNRLVSQGDVASFCNQAFSDYIIQAQVLTYKDIGANSSAFNLLPPGGLSNYWFNYLFIIALPRYGNTITTDQRNFILNTLNTVTNSMETVEYELLSGILTPIDIRARITLTNTGNALAVESQAKLLIQNYFLPTNHTMGELLEYGPIEKLLLNIQGVADCEMAMNRNPGNKLTPDDYIVAGSTSATQNVQQVKRNLVLQLLAKDPALLQIINPQFSVTNTTTNTTKWVFSADIQMAMFEMPTLGNIIITFT